MPYEDPTADLIHQALTAEADRAPDTGQVLHALLGASRYHRHGRGRTPAHRHGTTFYPHVQYPWLAQH